MIDVTTTTRVPQVREVAWDHPDAVALRAAMSAEIDPRYADRAASMPPPAGMRVDPADLVFVAVAYVDGRAVGHVAVRRLGEEVEVKRMFVEQAARGNGIGTALLAAAESAARARGAARIVLQTGDRQPEAVATYAKAGYTRIPIFAPYLSLPFSRCFEKLLPAGVDATESR